jgi:TonB-linked SusC/RagA family outer membrane protein
MRKIASLLSVLMLLCTLAFGQNRTVTGQVKDENGNAVPFATITETGTQNATTADAEGNFTISIRPAGRLTVTATGFEAQSLAPAQGAQSITLARGEAQLSEVVVTTALGIRRQAKELGYSTARVSNAELTQARTVNLQNGLTGKVAGLNITTVNSGVFEETKIVLRGIRSLTGNNQPLLVVDGIPTPLTFISSLNPNDVQDVNILKGASAAAIYGPDGVNGVIIVSTRKGTSGKPFVTVSHTAQLARVSFMPDLQERFGSGTTGEDQFGRPIYVPYENQQFGPEFNGEMVQLGKPLEDGTVQMVPYRANDERRKFWNNGLTLQTDVSFGAQDFYISAQDVNIKGLTPKDENRRTSFRLNASRTYGKFKAGLALTYVQNNYDVVNNAAYSGRFASSYNGSVYFTVLNTPGHVPLTSYKNQNSPWADPSSYYNEYFVSPYWAIDAHRTKGRNNDLLASLQLDYSLASWLQATYRLGGVLGFNQFKSETAPLFVNDYAKHERGFEDLPGAVNDGQNINSRITHEFFLSGRQNVSDFGVSYIVGGRYRQNDNKNTNVTGVNLVVPYLYNVSNRSGEAFANEANFRARLLSLFGQVGVSYKGWANLEFVAANDWDSRLNINNNSYFYPGVNASVVLTDAIPSLKGNRILSYAKVRGSISKSANVNLGVYQLEPTYSSTGGFPYGNIGGYSADNQVTDPAIQPEFVNSKEIGFELGFMRNRINLDATYYFQNNTNQILQVDQSWATGYPVSQANTADFDNYGFEVSLNLTPLVRLGDGRINFRTEVTYNNNEVTSVAGGITEVNIGGSANFTQLSASSPDVYNAAIVGQPAFVFKLTDYERDPQGRVIVDRVTGLPKADDSLVVRGRSLPVWMVGFNPSFNWKGLVVGMTWEYRGGHYAYHGIGTDMDFTGISGRSAQYGRQRFVFPNSVYWDGSKYVENTNVQVNTGGASFWANGSTNTSVGTNYFSSAAFWKLRELVIGYEIPSNSFIGDDKIIKKVAVSAVARNLLTFVPKTNQWTDPEFNFTSTGNTFGINNVFSQPPARIFGGSVVLTF